MEPQIDARLAILMQWLKDNDETSASKREHANKDGTWVPEVIEGEGYD
jgi:hypothetical protein